MSDNTPAKPAPKKKKKPKDFARINSVKMCKVSDGRPAHNCKHCGTNQRIMLDLLAGR